MFTGSQLHRVRVFFLCTILCVCLPMVFAAELSESLDPVVGSSLTTQKDQALEYIKSGQLTEAEAALDKLKSDYANTKDFDQTLFELAECYRANQQEAQALSLHQYNVANTAPSESSLRSQVEVIAHYMRQKDDSLVETEPNAMKSRFSEQAGLPTAIGDLAAYSVSLGRSDRARAWLADLDKQWPNHKASLNVQGALALKSYRSRDKAAKAADMKNLLTRFEACEDEQLDAVIHGIGKCFEWSGQIDGCLRINTYNAERFAEEDYAERKHGFWSLLAVVRDYGKLKDADKIEETVSKWQDILPDEFTTSCLINAAAEQMESLDKSRFESLLSLNSAKFKGQEHACKSQGHLARHYIETGRYEQADEAIESLRQDYPEHQPQVSGQCFWLGMQYLAADEKNPIAEPNSLIVKSKGTEFEPHSLGSDPSSRVLAIAEMLSTDKALSAVPESANRGRLLKCAHAISKGNKVLAESVLSEADLKDKKVRAKLANDLYWMGRFYRNQDLPAKAINMLNFNREQFADDKWSMVRSYHDTAMSQIALNDSLNAQAMTDELIADYGQTSGYRVEEYICIIGEEFFGRGVQAISAGNIEKGYALLDQAIAVWEKELQEVRLAPEDIPYIMYYLAQACYQRQDYDKALDYYQQTAAYTDFNKAWSALYHVAKIYEKMLKQNRASADQVRSVYRTLLERYPDCPASKVANHRLNTL